MRQPVLRFIFIMNKKTQKANLQKKHKNFT